MHGCSLAWGISTLLIMIVGLIPLLGALNWLNLLYEGAGLIFSLAVFALKKEGNRRAPIAGIICCSIAIIICILRPILGWGIF